MPGLDKSERLREKREAEFKDQEIPPLDPPYPYDVIEFDPVFFQIPPSPPLPVDSASR